MGLLLLLLLLLLPSLLQPLTLPEASSMLRMSSATLTMAMPTSTLLNKKLETPTEVSAEDTLMLMPTEPFSRFNTLLMEPASVLPILVFQLLLSMMVLPQPSTLSPWLLLPSTPNSPLLQWTLLRLLRLRLLMLLPLLLPKKLPPTARKDLLIQDLLMDMLQPTPPMLMAMLDFLMLMDFHTMVRMFLLVTFVQFSIYFVEILCV